MTKGETTLNESSTKKSTRRSVLKTAGAASGAALMGIHTVKAAGTEYDRGSVTFIEMKLQYGSVPRYPRLTADNLANYSIDTANDRVLLTGARPGQIVAGSGVVSESRTFSTVNDVTTQEVGRDPSRVSPDTDYRHLHATYLELASPRQRPTVTTELTPDGIEVSTGMQSTRVGPDSESSLELDRETVTVDSRNGGTRTVTLLPKLHVHNHGELRVLGAENERLLPLDSDDPYAQARVSAVTNREDVTRRQGEDILVIPDTN